MALGRQGYTDWVGVKRGRGRSLEIAVYAVRLDAPAALPRAIRRRGAPDPDSRSDAGFGPPREERVDRLLGFAGAVRR